MTDIVRILRYEYDRRMWSGDRKRCDYAAYCLRCHREVKSNAGRVGVVQNYVWASKAPAVKAAREHLQMHRNVRPQLNNHLSNPTRKGTNP